MVPPYVLHRGGEEWEIGLVVGSFGIVSLLVRPFAGKWTYLLGAKRVAVAGSVIFAVASILYVPALEVWAIVPVRMLQGVGMAMNTRGHRHGSGKSSAAAPARRSTQQPRQLYCALGPLLASGWLLADFEPRVRVGIPLHRRLCGSRGVTRALDVGSPDPGRRQQGPRPQGAAHSSWCTLPHRRVCELYAYHRTREHVSATASRDSRTRQSRPLLHGQLTNDYGDYALCRACRGPARPPGADNPGPAVRGYRNVPDHGRPSSGRVPRRGRLRRGRVWNDPAGHAVVHGGPGPSSSTQPRRWRRSSRAGTSEGPGALCCWARWRVYSPWRRPSESQAPAP